MEITRIADLRPRFVWDIIDDAFDLYREKFALLCGISTLVFAPAYLLDLGLSSLTSGYNKSNDSDASNQFLSFVFITVPILLTARVLQTAAVSSVIESLFRGEAMTIRGAFRRISRHLFPLILAMVLTIVAAAGGGCFFLIGALFVACYAAFVPQAIVIEKLGLRRAIQRSIDLVSGDSWRLIGILCLLFVVTTLLSLGLYGIIEIVYYLIPTGATSGAAREAQKEVVQTSMTSLVSLLLEPLTAVAVTLLYYDLRVRREGMDLAAQAQEIDVALAPDPFGDTPSAKVVRRASKQKGKRK